MRWQTAYIMGEDVTGRRCRVAAINVPDYFSFDQKLAYIRNRQERDGDRPYANIQAADISIDR